MKFRIVVFYLFAQINLFSQQSVPYFSSFDSSDDSEGWSHYAITGSDDWEVGPPTNSPYSAPNCFVTGIDGSFEGNSNRVLETPTFDLSETGVDYSLSFFHKRQAVVANNYYYLEYSINDGVTWSLLDQASAQKKNWQTINGFSNNYYSSFQHSAINLSFLQGNSQIKFRFRFQSGFPDGQGWMIDNFSIAEDSYNLTAFQGDSISISQRCLQFDVSSFLGFYNQYTQPFENTTYYYLSQDMMLDPLDAFLGEATSTSSESITNFQYEVNLSEALNVGEYYVLYQHDALDSLEESNEYDNIGFAVLQIDTVLELPYVENFEAISIPWKVVSPGSSFGSVWELGSGYRHHIEGAHSGVQAWHTSKTIFYTDNNNASTSNIQYLESPNFDLQSDTGDIIMNIWFKNEIAANHYRVEHRLVCDQGWSTLFNFPNELDDDWDFINESLAPLVPYGTSQFRVKFTSSYLAPEGLIFDDVYIGHAKPDLTIENDNSDRFSAVTEDNLDLKYYFFNSGLIQVPQVDIQFYWSPDNVLDVTDIYLGGNSELNVMAESRYWSSFDFVKPTTAEGIYYVFYIIDDSDLVDEMREYNNVGYFTIHQQNVFPVPYLNDFETEVTDWRHDSSLGSDDWYHGIPQGDISGMAFSGQNAWITADTGLVTPMSRMHLYTPLFDLNTVENPVLEFNMILGPHNNCECSLADLNMSYSVDHGATWRVLDTTNTSYNRWYYPIEYESGVDQNYYLANSTYLMISGGEKSFVGVDQYNSRDANRNTHYVLDLNFLQGDSIVQFRYNLASKFVGDAFTNSPINGVVLDDFSITESSVDLAVEYQKHLMISSLSDQIRFFMHVKNKGNYISNPSAVQYYLSSDQFLDDGDYNLGQFELTAIRPDLNRYVNVAFDGPSELDNYQFLVYELDINGTNSESNELNNVGFWPLSLDSLSVFPYANHFEDHVVDGWHQYAVGPFDDNITRYRWRNQTAPGEALYQSAIVSGQWFTEPVASGALSYRPTFYLESPAFDFSNFGVIDLSFVLMCTGRAFQQVDGGNLQYSVDGGNTWNVLNDFYGTAQNWYDFASLSELDGEPGWSGQPLSYGVPDFDSVHVDVSFLGGESHVVFRFKYRSNHYYYGEGNVQGMRLDDFGIQGLTLDYIANDILEPVNVSVLDASLDLGYSISCNGETDGLSSSTTFYWSTDNILDENDPLILIVDELPIDQGSTLSAIASVNYPTPISQQVYYVFYVADGEFDIGEMNELNNVGSFLIEFTDYDAILEQNGLEGLTVSFVNGTLILSNHESVYDGQTSLDIFDSSGKLICSEMMYLLNGTTELTLPKNLASGVYSLRFTQDHYEFSKSLLISK